MVLHPVGPHSTAVYWRRRIVPIVVLVIIIVLLAKACGGSSPNANGPTTTPKTTPTPTPITACVTRKLTVAVGPVTANSTAGDPVKFSATVETTGSKACRLIVPPAKEVWAVTSGGSPVWTDSGCQTGSAGVDTLVHPHRLLTLHLKWDGTHTGDGCKAGTPAVAGTYAVTLTLGPTASSPVPFVLTQA